MNKIKYFLMVLVVACLCGACGNVNTSTESIAETSTESVEASAETVISEINGFIKADYTLYSSLAQTEERSGDFIYIEGVVGQYVEYASRMAFTLKDNNDNVWIVSVGERPFHSKKKVEALVGQEITVFGSFLVCSEEGVPAVTIEKDKTYIQTAENEDMYLTDFTADRDEVLLWFEENPNEILFSEHSDVERAGTFAMSTGVVECATKYADYWVDFYQKTEEGFESQYIIYDEIYFGKIEDVLEFSLGDGIRFYYYINDKNDVEILAIESAEIDFTFEDIASDYKSKCKEYSYEEIARNPESVRGEDAQITGEVIQVIEQYDYVYLRVNITENKYGYYEDTIYASYKRKSETEDRILEDDIITIYGKLAGTETYTSVLGASITLPRISGEYIEILTE